MRVGFAYDLKTDWPLSPSDPLDANAEFDGPETVESVTAALRHYGHEVVKIGNVRNLLARINTLATEVDIVFNICEGRVGRNRESQVPVILEAAGIPYVGSDGLALGLTLEKSLAKKCFLADGIPTPRFLTATGAADLRSFDHLRFPLLVKATREGTSKGLTTQSKVYDHRALTEQVERIVNTYHQPALIEEFIAGIEVTVPVLGNHAPEAMPVIQYTLNGDGQLGERFYTYEMVALAHNRDYLCPAPISKTLSQKIQQWAVRAYQSVGCRDFGRVDFRVDQNENPYVLEINPLPNLSKGDSFNLFPQVIGSSYDEIINRILHYALARYGLDQNLKARTSGNIQQPSLL